MFKIVGPECQNILDGLAGKFSQELVTQEGVSHSLKYAEEETETERHRVDRVLSFFSSRRNWDFPNPLPAGEYASPPLVPGGGAHSLARKGVGESQFRRGDIHCGTLYR
jgi:hypothetical protein